MRAISILVVCVLASSSCFAGLVAPNYEWWRGSAPTVAGMMMGYYDINGYAGLRYDNLVPGGVAEMNTFGNPAALVNGIIASPQHVANYYIGGYGASGDDCGTHSPNCLADFMGTSQDSAGNANGSTTFYYWTNGGRFHAAEAFAYGVWQSDGMYGIGEYLRYAGYDFYDPAPGNLTDDMLYSQLTDTSKAYYFSFADFKAEIDAGRPVMVHLTGHDVLGYDYIDGGGVAANQIMICDTWTSGGHVMTWNGTYSGLDMYGVTVLELTGGTAQVPEPASMTLVGMGVLALVGVVRRRRMS